MRTLDPGRRSDDRRSRRAEDPPRLSRGSTVTDVAYVVLTVALFAVLALALHGLEKL